MTREWRTDHLDVDLKTLWRDESGFLHFRGATLARTGVLTYKRTDGTEQRELVRPESLFSPAALSSLPGLPITDRHPPRMLTPQNVAQYQRGAVTSAQRLDERYLGIDGVITDAVLADKVEQKKQVELSPGYWCDIAPNAGRWDDGEHYDVEQQPRAYNHAAVVPKGRCSETCGGSTCKCAIRTDEGQMIKTVKMTAAMAAKLARQDGAMVDVPADMIGKVAKGMDPAEAIDFLLGILAAQGADEPDEPAPPAPGQPLVPSMNAGGSQEPSPRPAPTGDVAAQLAQVVARLEKTEARADAAEKALERQAKAHADAVRTEMGASLAAIERAKLVVGQHFDGATLAPVEIDRVTLMALYPAEKEQVKAFSQARVDAEIAHAFHPTRPDPQVKRLRENAGAGGLSAVGLIEGRKDGSEFVAARDDFFKHLNGKAKTA